MSKTKSIYFYLTRISQVCDDLVLLREMVLDEDLVRIALNRFSKKWTSFIEGVASQENIPNYERLRDDFIQEETHVEALHSRQLKSEEDEEIVALVSGERKGKWDSKLNIGGQESSNERKKKIHE